MDLKLTVRRNFIQWPNILSLSADFLQTFFTDKVEKHCLGKSDTFLTHFSRCVHTSFYLLPCSSMIFNDIPGAFNTTVGLY